MHLKTSSTRRAPSSVVILSLVLLAIIAPATFAVEPYGLTARQPVAPYLNMPQVPPVPAGDFITVKAFPNLVFQNLTYVTGAPRSNLMYVCEREGYIYSFVNESSTSTKNLVLDISAQCQGWSDSGLLGLVFHPEFGMPGSPNRGYFYVFYNYSQNPVPGPAYLQSDIPSYDRLSRFTIPDGSFSADPSSEMVLIEQFDQSLWHNGGSMFFSPDDGFLYLSLGDQGGANDQYNSAQSITGSFFSGILRIDVDKKGGAISHAPLREPVNGKTTSHGINYYIPNDNPWVGVTNALEEFYCIGLRAPHRMSYDAVSHKLWVGDVGQSTSEEVNIIEKGGNYQWSYKEGTANGPKTKPSPLIGTDKVPYYEYLHADGNNCVIGGYVYRGIEHAADLAGKYIFGDNGSGHIWKLDPATTPPTVTLLCNMPPGAFTTGLSSFGVDGNGEIYMCQMGDNGQVYKLARTSTTGTPFPTLLSQTGVYSNTAAMTPATGIIPFGVNTPLWSDGALKNRLIALPNDGAPYSPSEVIKFFPTGEWQFPAGTVFVKHFELVVDETTGAKKRLETRLLVRDPNNGVYGVTYKWRSDNTEADLLTSALSETLTIKTANGTRQQTWYYPSRSDCLSCHTSNAGGVLGVKTRQLNGVFNYPSGVSDNQLRSWSHVGMFDQALVETDIPNMTKLSAVTDTSVSLETRVRSYIDANCSHCHRPNGVQGLFDARFDTPIAQQGIVNGTVANSLGIDNAKVIKPQDQWRSMMYKRASSVEYGIKMPWLAKNEVDTQAMAVLLQYINSLAGTPTLAPPTISPPDGLYGNAITISIQHPDAGSTIYYTTNGTTPTTNSTVYTGPFTISTNTTVKAIAAKAGSDNSVAESANYLFTNLRDPENPSGAVNGLVYNYYQGVWDVLPDFSQLTSIENGVRGNFSILPRQNDDNFAFKFTGYIDIPANGYYTFYLDSDDGSKLYIGNTLVVDNDGLHPMIEKSGSIGLKAGKHAITVTYFEQGWSEGLQVSFAGVGISKEPIPDNLLYYVADGLRPADNPANPVAGVNYKYYEGNWSTMPNFAALTPVETGTRSNFAILPRLNNDFFGFSFTGFVLVPADGFYTFYTSSDDGSKLFIGDTLIVNNDGLHPMQEKSGVIGLKAGLHAIKVEFFEQGWDEGLQVSYSGPGVAKTLIPNSALFYGQSNTNSTVTLSNLTQTYNGTPKSATVTTNPPGLTVEVTYDDQPTPPTNPGSYDVLAVVTQPGYQGSATGTLVINSANATVTLSNLTQTYNGTPKSATVTTNPAGLSVSVTYNNQATPPTDPGSYTVLAVITQLGYQGSATGTLVINKATATVTLSNLTQTYSGTPKSVTVTTNPAGLAVTVLYKNSAALPVLAGSYTVSATVNDSKYIGSATGTLVITKATATVTLSNLTQVYDGTAKAVTVTTAPPNLETKVTYNGAAKVPNKIGSYQVVATVKDNNYQGSATGTLNIVKSGTAITSALVVTNTVATEPAPTIAAPGNLNAIAASASQINLSWTDNSSNETGFTIERSADGVNWSLLTIVAANTTTYSDAGLTAATTYSYRVRAYNDVGNSDWSNVATAITFSAKAK